ncbi:hypothetical protein FB45DRAFT_457828 [Roridomyces roridus]|uniref:Uncharacterized protein n=1 Tax=Roridomyces roridus TaxID=1738132 RepID=A0AAD7C2L0_9AGAR|nr:hypothetical protein FB45DRAFT_457828 [Roridomyces roridus]
MEGPPVQVYKTRRPATRRHTSSNLPATTTRPQVSLATSSALTIPAMFSAFSPIKLVNYVFGQTAPAPSGDRERKHHHRKAYKPAPLVSRLQQFKRLEHGARLGSQSSSSRASSLGSFSSSGSSSLTSSETVELDAPAPAPKVDQQQDTFFDMEIARLQIHNHRNGAGIAVADPFANGLGVRHLHRQASRDRFSLETLPKQAPPIFYHPEPSALRTPPSFIVRKWREWKNDVDSMAWDRQVLALVQGDLTAQRWALYQQRWDVALHDTEDCLPLIFHQIPWPVQEIVKTPEQIKAVDVHRYLFGTITLADLIPEIILPRLAQEIVRWRADRVELVLQNVVFYQREEVAIGAGIVYEILLEAEAAIKQSAVQRAECGL